jgi:hypothetical protein
LGSTQRSSRCGIDSRLRPHVRLVLISKATPFPEPPIAKNQRGKNAARRRAPNAQALRIQIASQKRLKETKNCTDQGARPSSAGKRSWNPVVNSSTKWVACRTTAMTASRTVGRIVVSLQ